MIRPEGLDTGLLDQIEVRLAAGRPVRRVLPRWGRLHVDRQLPFLVIYRRPRSGFDRGTDRLAVGVASYLQADGDPKVAGEIAALVTLVGRVARAAYGAFLIIEVWAGPAGDDGASDTPAYRIATRRGYAGDPVVEEMARALRESRATRQRPEVSVGESRSVSPPGMRQILTGRQLDALGADLIGLEVRPVYRQEDGEEVFPVLARQIARRLSTVFDRTAYRFTVERTTARPLHHHALGRRALVKAVWDVDSRLAEIGESFDPLLQVTPINAEQSWTEFRRSRFQRRPNFRYRPLPFDPGRMKHRLWAVRPERVEDPTLMYLFRDVQVQLDRQLSLLAEIERPEFLHTSLQLHGGVEPGLLSLAESILEGPSRAPRAERRRLTAKEFTGLATAEVLAYRAQYPQFGTVPEVRDDMYSGLLVSRGRMFVGAETTVPVMRADALIQHEIGTHMLTYHNGRSQPLRLLSLGLPGYDELQEGLAVLGEYLVGGLDRERARTLAARVVAVHAMTEGACFVETWRLLRDRGFTQRAAFTIATRVYRGGGLAKDAMYLRGFMGILDYVADGCEFDRLFLGKFAVKHVPVIDELLLRKVLSPAQVLPRYLQRSEVQGRLAMLREGLPVIDLVKGNVRRR